MKLRPLTLILVFCACQIVRGYIYISEVFVSQWFDYDKATNDRYMTLVGNDANNNDETNVLDGRETRYLYLVAEGNENLDNLIAYV